jgi:hypothetical protein
MPPRASDREPLAKLRRYVHAHPGSTVLMVARGLNYGPITTAHWLADEVRGGRMHTVKGCGPRRGKGYFTTCQRHTDCRTHPSVGRACMYQTMQDVADEWLHDLEPIQ